MRDDEDMGQDNVGRLMKAMRGERVIVELYTQKATVNIKEEIIGNLVFKGHDIGLQDYQIFHTDMSKPNSKAVSIERGKYIVIRTHAYRTLRLR